MTSVFSSVQSLTISFAVILSLSNTLLAAQTATGAVTTSDGGTREVLESIFIPPLPHAPFSLTLETEWKRPLANNGSYTLANKRQIMRDSAGRIYQERWALVPKNGKVQSEMDYIQIADPTDHTLYNCEISAKKCYLLTYAGSTTTVYKQAVKASGPLPDGNGYHNHEDLGHDNIAGLDCVGYRETTTVNPGVFGNDQPAITVREFWYSQQLGINLLSKLDSSQIGKQVFTVRDLNTSEPDSQPFKLPEGFAVIDQRTTQSRNN
jgi:hypothetical protein